MLTLLEEKNQIRAARAMTKDLTTVQKKAVKLLATGLTIDCVAGACACTSATIHNWKKKDNFRIALAEEIDIDAELHRFELKAIYGKAIYRVSELIEDRNPQVALAACKLAFEAEQNILRIAEETEMLRALESRMDQLAVGGAPPSLFEPAQDVEVISDTTTDND